MKSEEIECNPAAIEWFAVAEPNFGLIHKSGMNDSECNERMADAN